MWLCGLGLAGFLTHWLLMRLMLPVPAVPERRHLFNVSEAFIITLNPAQCELQLTAQKHLGLDTIHVFRAINGSEALRLAYSELPLYTKHLLQFSARHDHMQLSSGPMLGCLLSHMAIWRRVRMGTAVIVLEEVS